VILLAALTCAGFPLLITKLPAIMSRDPQAAAPGMPVALAGAVFLLLASVSFIRNRAICLALVAILASIGYLSIKVEDFPVLDAAATARPVGRRVLSAGVPVCTKREVPRDWRYGLNYYTEKPLPDCDRLPDYSSFVGFHDHKLFVELTPP
jgi:hypothetical protein